MNTFLTVMLEAGDNPFSLVTPNPGLSIWALIIFVILIVVLGKFGFKPIASALKEREQNIADSLAQAEKARAEMALLTAKNEELLNQAKEERNKILSEARDAAEKIKADLVEKAHAESVKKMSDAFREIDTQKKAAIVEIKNVVGQMALQIAEKVVRKELQSDAAQKEFVDKLVKETNLN
ncbi:MAG: atpF [Bacteroidetes bacterium]|nr:atpF [Bacteroidota bacterium]